MKWLIYGLLASILFGLWGLFDKLSAFQSPFSTNFILYSSALIFGVLAIIINNKKIRFSKNGFWAGLFAGIANFFLLYALLKNQLILVLPFVSMASVIFFLIILLTEKPKYSAKQKIFSSLGMLLCLAGIFLVSTGTIGLANFFQKLTLSGPYVFSAAIVMLGYSLWTYFTYRAVAKEKNDAVTYNFWSLLASFLSAVAAIMIFSPKIFSDLSSLTALGYIYPALAGICVAAGGWLVYLAFQKTTTQNKLQEVMVAVLANGELIPLLFLSYFVLGEWVPEGFIGVIIVLIGLFSIHYAEVSK